MNLQVGIIMKRIALILMYSLFFSAQTHAWTITADFENGVVGDRPADNFIAMPTTTFSTDYARSGQQSAKAWIKAGTTGDDTGVTGESGFGGKKGFRGRPDVGQGDELWARVWYYFPPGFDMTVGGNGLKLQRYRTTSGTIAILLRDDGLRVGNEINNPLFGTTAIETGWGKTDLGQRIPRGEWMAVEHHVKFHSVPGQAIYRVWQNGNLVFEDTKTNTLKSASDTVNDFQIFSYWNGGAPKSQAAYIDDMVMTNDRPSNTDKHGNPMIGIGNFVILAPPNPPTIE